MEIIITYMVVALVLSAICSVCEAALSSTPMTFITTLEGKKGAETLRNFKENMDKPLSAILIVNTIANTVGASLVGSAASSYAIEQGYSESTVIGIISAVFTVLVLMFAEILPKTIGANYWKGLILTVVKVIQFMIWITYPLVYLLGFVTRFLSNKEANAIRREEIAAVGTEGLKGGVIDEQEHTIIQRVLSLKNHKIEEIMVPATMVESVKENDVVSASAMKFSRIPVIGEKGLCLGYIVKDDLHGSDVSVKDHIKPISFYHDETSVREVFSAMAEKKETISAVVDAYGLFRGVVSFEDIIEAIMGIEILDENDVDVDEQEMARNLFKNAVTTKN